VLTRLQNCNYETDNYRQEILKIVVNLIYILPACVISSKSALLALSLETNTLPKCPTPISYQHASAVIIESEGKVWSVTCNFNVRAIVLTWKCIFIHYMPTQTYSE